MRKYPTGERKKVTITQLGDLWEEFAQTGYQDMKCPTGLPCLEIPNREGSQKHAQMRFEIGHQIPNGIIQLQVFMG